MAVVMAWLGLLIRLKLDTWNRNYYMVGTFNKKTIRDIENLENKTVLVRVDYNVPIDSTGLITDDYRIRQSLPTIEHLRAMGAKIVLISHLGRPLHKNDPACSLESVATKLSDLLHLPVAFAKDCLGDETKKQIKNLQKGDILLLENLRYYPQEEENDSKFAEQLASGCDYFVQDAFGTVHRAHASTFAITKFLPSYSGILVEKEVRTILEAINQAQRPLAVIVGGAKISDKIDILKVFIEKADFVAVVGAMANTFLLATGIEVGTSLVEKDSVQKAKDILALAHKKSQNEKFSFYLPHDVVVAKELTSRTHIRVVDLHNNTWSDISSYPKVPLRSAYQVASDEKILDIGPMTAAHISGALRLSKTAIWNGTAGVTEIKGWHGAADPFAHGTKIIVEGLVGEYPQDKDHPFSVVGGGDTIGYVESIEGLRDKFGHVSTGGGASLDLLAGKKLPGVESLLDK